MIMIFNMFRSKDEKKIEPDKSKRGQTLKTRILQEEIFLDFLYTHAHTENDMVQECPHSFGTFERNHLFELSSPLSVARLSEVFRVRLSTEGIVCDEVFARDPDGFCATGA